MSSTGNTKTSGNTVSSRLSADNSTVSTSDIMFQIFSNSNIAIMIWFLVIYFILYLLISLFRPGTQSNSIMRVFDIVILGCLLVYLVATFFQDTEKERTDTVKSYYNTLKAYMDDPTSLFAISLFIIVLYTIIFILGIPMEWGAKPITVMILENGAWILLIVVLIASFFKYVLGISLTDYMDKGANYLQSNANKAENVLRNGNTVVSGNTVSSNALKQKEVFNIANNMYTYDDAQSICQSFGARLAKYEEIEDAYNKGGEWCNYGWSDNQSAYFPTQKSTWDALQTTKTQKNKCGRPGINGGYIDDPNARYGVNCYGVKPKPKNTDLEKLSGSAIPKSADDLIMEMKIKFWKENADKILQVNSYNTNKWSQF
jgi:hypothetical protein